jgi:uncharacterized protein
MEDALRRQAAAVRFAQLQPLSQTPLACRLRLAYIVEPQPLSAPASRDPDNDHVLACALSAHADLIVTRDLDLLDLKTYRDIPILAAADALRRIEAQR